MLAARGDPDPYEPVHTPAINLTSCHMCYGLNQFCLDAGIYHCRTCKHTWQRRIGDWTNPKAYHHFQGYAITRNDTWPAD